MNKTLIKLTMAVVLALGLVRPAGAVYYTVNFSDGGANVGSGIIHVLGGYAVNGYFDVTAGDATGSWLVYTAGGTGSYLAPISSPSGAFSYDNAVYTASNPQFPVSNPFLDGAGLLFTSGSGDELGLWGNADGSYSLYGYIGGNYHPTVDFGGATLTSAIPEPINLAWAGFGLILVGGSAGRWYAGRRRFAMAG